jgi:threonine synthase
MFDDCQDMVKNLSGRKFATPQFNTLINMTLVTKMFYFFFAYKALKTK